MQLLPNAKSQFVDANGAPLANGTVGFYIPATLTAKTTWQDQAGTIPNANPVVLDSRGQALIWGTGTYRQILKDASGVTIWDGLTQDPSVNSNPQNLLTSVAGTGDAITATLAPAVAAYAQGTSYSFVAIAANTTTTPTLNINGLGAVTLVASDKSALQVGVLQSGTLYELIYDGAVFRAVSPIMTAPAILMINNTGAVSDIALNIGQSAYIDVVASASVPLHIATGDNQKYDIEYLLQGTATGTTGYAVLLPNNTSYTNFFSNSGYTWGNGTSSVLGVYSNGFQVGYGDIRGGRTTVSTATKSKNAVTLNTAQPSGTPPGGVALVSLWQAAASSGGAADTTTPYTSMGTLSFPSAQTGRIIMRRVA